MAPPRLVTSYSTAALTAAASLELASGLRAKAGEDRVAGGLVYATSDHVPEELGEVLSRALPGIPFAGATSCRVLGVSGRGLVPAPALAALWFVGDGFTFSTALGQRGPEGRISGRSLGTEVARRAALGPGAVRCAVVHSTPGEEESLVRELGEALSLNALVGGSAADDDGSGHWAVWTDRQVSRDGAVVAVTDWPWRLAAGFESGYLATARHGIVTRAEGRVMHQIDGRPAAEVYNAWTGGSISASLGGGSVVASTTLAPLGLRRPGASETSWAVAHPASVVGPDRSLAVFIRVSEGDEVMLLRGTPQALVGHPQRVAGWSLGLAEMPADEVAGAVLSFCAGCMLAIGNDAPLMLDRFAESIGGQPFVAFFGFGEQGCLRSGTPAHENLMTSLLVLGQKPR